MNRGNGRMRVFGKDGEAFLRVIEEVHVKRPMRVLAYCLMPNHFHLVVWPRQDGDLSRWMALVVKAAEGEKI